MFLYNNHTQTLESWTLLKKDEETLRKLLYRREHKTYMQYILTIYPSGL